MGNHVSGSVTCCAFLYVCLSVSLSGPDWLVIQDVNVEMGSHLVEIIPLAPITGDAI